MPLDLSRRRDLGAILNDAFKLYGQHFSLFAVLAFGVVIPIELLFGGVGLGQLWGDYDEDAVFGPGGGAVAMTTFVEVPLITAMHIQAVLQISRGETPTVGETARKGAAVFWPVFGTLLLSILGIIGGLILLIIPGIYLTVRWFFASQVVVVENLKNRAALKRSGELVQDNWWRVFGYGIVFQLVLIPVALMAIPFEVAAESADRSVFSLVGTIFVNGVSLSFVALTATLLYFDLRAQKEGGRPAAVPAGAWTPPIAGTGLPLGDSPSAQPPGSTPPPSQPPPVMPPGPEAVPRPDVPPPPQIFDPPRD